MKVRQINSFENWMSPDEYKGGDGYFYYGERCKVDKYSKKVVLQNKTSITWSYLGTWINNSVSGFVNLSSTQSIYSTKDGYIARTLSWDWIYKDKIGKNYFNVFFLWNYWCIFTSSGTLHRWSFVHDTFLWVSTDNLISNDYFTDFTWRTAWAGRSINYWALHTPWSTATLVNTATTITASKYVRVKVEIFDRTAWSITVNVGWVGTSAKTASFEVRLNTISTASITITPTSDFDGNIKRIEYFEAAVVEDYLTGLTPATETCPIVQFQWNFVYIWTWNVMHQIDISTSSRVRTTKLTLPKWNVIVWMTAIWDQINVYVDNWVDWIQYIRDWFSAAVDRKIVRYWLPMKNVANIWNIDYVICNKSSISYLYKVSWYDKILLFKSNYQVEGTNTWYINDNSKRFSFTANKTNAIETMNNKVFFWWWTGSKIDGSAIYAFGSLLPWQGENLNVEYTVQGTLQEVTAISYADSWSNLYIAVKSSSSINGYYNNIYTIYLPETWNWQFTDSWYIETMPFHGDGFGNIKSFQKMRVGYSLVANTSIKVRIKFDWWAYTLYKTITDTTIKHCVITGDLLGKKFYECQVKFELISATFGDNTPSLYLPITIRYNDDDQT